MKVLIVEDHADMRQLIRSVKPFTSADWVMTDSEVLSVDRLEATRLLRATSPKRGSRHHP